MFHQPLFGNSKIWKQDGTPWGMEPGSRFSLWAIRGIQCLENLWKKEGNRWKIVRCLKKITHSRNTTKKKESFICSVPWNLKRPNPLQKPTMGQWKVLELP
jgi:hypothetical protein